ncbi:MAG: hypothetical protein NTW38_12380 [Candidatus Aminicenantes bacterium]|nr:hypothetical protein [Candidatus Aminicenantes bacterium]
MNEKIFCFVIGIALVIGGTAACKKGAEKPPAGTTPIDQLIQAGKAPVGIGSLIKGISPVAPTFSVLVVNVSDAPVKLINGTVVFFDENGKPLPEAVQEAGYTDLSPIPPGDKIELFIIASDDRAVTGKWIIKDVIYEKPNPVDKLYGNLPFKWTNPNYEAELAAEKNK